MSPRHEPLLIKTRRELLFDRWSESPKHPLEFVGLGFRAQLATEAQILLARFIDGVWKPIKLRVGLPPFGGAIALVEVPTA